MHKRGAWRRRGFAIVAVALAFAVIAPELALPAGAVSSRVELAGKRRKRAVSPAVRKARILAAMKAQALAKAKTNAAKPTTTVYSGAKKPKPKAALTGAGAAKLRRALAAKRQVRKRPALNRRAAAAALAAKRAAKRNKKKKKKSSLPSR